KFVGGSVSFAVGAYSPSAVAYQWRFNGTNISAATNVSLTLNNLQLSNAGNYSVVLTNSSGSITSAVAVLTVLGEPIILSQPSDLRVLAGSNVTFSLVVSNSDGVTDYWQLNGATVFITPTNSGSFYPVTNYSFTASAASQGTYTVIASNAA